MKQANHHLLQRLTALQVVIDCIYDAINDHPAVHKLTFRFVRSEEAVTFELFVNSVVTAVPDCHPLIMQLQGAGPLRKKIVESMKDGDVAVMRFSKLSDGLLRTNLQVSDRHEKKTFSGTTAYAAATGSPPSQQPSSGI